MFVVATVVVSCGDGRQEGSPRPVRLGVIQASDQLPLFVMQEQGFAAEQGLRLDLQAVQSGGEVIRRIADGELDGGLPGMVPVLNAALKDVIPDQVRGVAGGAFADRTHPHTAVIVGPSVREWSDLSGARIAVNDLGTITEASVRLRLEIEGVTGYQLIPVRYPNQGLAVRDGVVAAAGMAEPFVSQSLERGDGRVLDWVIGGQPFPDFQIVMLVVRTSLLEQDPEVARDLVAAYVQAYRWINEHPDEGRELLVRELGVTASVGEKMTLPRYPLDPVNDPDLIGRTQDRLLSLTPGERPLQVRSLYDERLLMEVLGRD